MENIRARTIRVMIAAVLPVLFLGMLSLTTPRGANGGDVCGDGSRDKPLISDLIPRSCTILSASWEDRVLFGNNEDWINPSTFYWVRPSIGGDHGAMYFGFDNFWPQGGINEKGLAFDVNALPKAVLNPHPELPTVKNPFYEFLTTCSTVEEVIDRVKDYSWGSSWRAQVHLADATGDAVVISVGPDGELAFTRKQKGNGYLISTNFNRANPKNGRYPCWRYDATVFMLEEIQAENNLTVNHVRSILDAVHQEGPLVNTVYSNIFDLKNGIIYLYHWHQFDEVVTLSVAEELARVSSPVRISSLFSQETVNRASNEYLAYQKKITPWKNLSWAWLLLAAGSLFLLIWDFARSPKVHWGIRLVWALVVSLFGPFGFVAYLSSYRHALRSSKPQIGIANWRCALGATAVAVAGYTIGITLAFFSLYFILSFSESRIWSIIARFYGLPLIVGLFLLHAPLAGFVMENGYWTMVRRGFLTEVTSLNFTLMGMLPVSGILMSLCEKHLTMRGPASVLFWSVIILGAFGGALTVYPLNVWRARRGFACWPVRFTAGGETVATENTGGVTSLGTVWGLLLLSFALLSGSVVLVFTYLGQG